MPIYRAVPPEELRAGWLLCNRVHQEWPERWGHGNKRSPQPCEPRWGRLAQRDHELICLLYSTEKTIV